MNCSRRKIIRASLATLALPFCGAASPDVSGAGRSRAATGPFHTGIVTGKPPGNFFPVYQDTSIFGKGYMDVTSVGIPDRFLFIGGSVNP